MKQDILIKRANYITKSNEICQEFYFAHPRTKIKLNTIFNTHFSGLQLWDLFSDEERKFENTWNKSVKIMYDLPVETHRYFIDQLSERQHLKSILIKRFLSFMESIRSSKKNIPKLLLSTIEFDTRSVTGSNLRKIMLLVNKSTIKHLNIRDSDSIHYHKILKEDGWKVGMIKEITDIKFDKMFVDGFSKEELEEILIFIATS